MRPDKKPGRPINAKAHAGCSSGKTGYDSRAKARKAIKYAGKGPTRSYRCIRCNLWHLTSQKSRNTPASRRG